MRICAAWLLKHATRFSTLSIFYGKPSVFTSGRCSLTPILRLLGRGFLVRTRDLYFNRVDDCYRRSARCGETCFGECAETRAELA